MEHNRVMCTSPEMFRTLSQPQQSRGHLRARLWSTFLSKCNCERVQMEPNGTVFHLYTLRVKGVFAINLVEEGHLGQNVFIVPIQKEVNKKKKSLRVPATSS